MCDVCTSVTLSVCFSASISQNRMSKLRKISCACCMWPCLGSSLAALRYLLCTSGLCMTSYLPRQRQRMHSQNDSLGRHRGRSPIFAIAMFDMRRTITCCSSSFFAVVRNCVTKSLTCRVARIPVFDGTIRLFGTRSG